ncbi:MAG: nucleotide excision repair endonuclease [Acidobacteria bacterium]|nr:nucleotide excision repair endonuclease [Acidobacteriota bacterium]
MMWGPAQLRQWSSFLRRNRLPPWTGEVLFLLPVLRRLFPKSGHRPAPGDLAGLLGLAPRDPDDMTAMAGLLLDALTSLQDRIPPEHLRHPKALQEWAAAGKPGIDFSRFGFDRAFLRRIPDSPGVYIMRNRAGQVIYVGKSRNLRRRVRSYFRPRALQDPKVSRIHKQLHMVECAPASSDLDALLMEMRLIRDYRPPINLQQQVHESPSRYARRRNLIIFVPQADDAGKASVYFLRDSIPMGSRTVPLGRPAGRKLRRQVRAVYFSPPSVAAPPPQEEWEAEVMSRWLAGNLAALNFVDVDQAGDCSSVLRQVRDYLRDPDALAQKVYYR